MESLTNYENQINYLQEELKRVINPVENGLKTTYYSKYYLSHRDEDEEMEEATSEQRKRRNKIRLPKGAKTNDYVKYFNLMYSDKCLKLNEDIRYIQGLKLQFEQVLYAHMAQQRRNHSLIMLMNG